MVRKKIKGVSANIKDDRAASIAFRESTPAEQSTPEPASSKSQPETPPFPSNSCNENKSQLKSERHRRTRVIGGLTQSLPDNENDISVVEADDHLSQQASSPGPNEHSVILGEQFIAGTQAEYLQKWKKAGWSSDDSASAKFDAHVKKMQGDNRLGPILKQYRLFINPTKMRTMLVQYPNRELGQEYREANGQKPLELRVKPKCGVVEVDIPLNIHVNFDKAKGIEYGQAMRNSRHLQQGGSYGLAGGLGVGPRLSAKDIRRAPMPEGPSKEKLLENFDDANNKGHVMNKITLGGRIVPFKDGSPIYMYVTFKGDICTFTRIDAIVQLRPQFDHVDALRDLEKLSAAHGDRTAEDTVADDADEGEAKAVNVAVKSAENLEESDLYGGMSATNKLLKAIRDEPWQKLKWIDQDDPESFDVFDENLVYQDPVNAPRLISEMTNEQYLDALSCPRIDPVKQGAKIMGNDDASMTTGATGTDVEQSSSEVEDETSEDDGKEPDLLEGANLAPGVIRPTTRRAQARVEAIARRLVIANTNLDHAQKNVAIRQMEGRMQKLFKNNPEFKFLFPDDPYNPYYKWRIAENRANRGVDPRFDLTEFGRRAKSSRLVAETSTE